MLKKKPRIGSNFDPFSAQASAYLLHRPNYPSEIIDFIAKNAEKSGPRGLVLDIGCGSGQAAVALAESGAFSRVFGIDRSSAMLDGFQAAIGGLKNNACPIQFKIGDAHQISSIFDTPPKDPIRAVVCAQSAHWLDLPLFFDQIGQLFAKNTENGPENTENGPKNPQNGPKNTENDLKTTQNDLKTTQNDLKTPENDPKTPQKAPKTPENGSKWLFFTGYSTVSVFSAPESPEMAEIFAEFAAAVSPFWSRACDRKILDAGFAEKMGFPEPKWAAKSVFFRVPGPKKRFPAADFVGYLKTWSAFVAQQKFLRENEAKMAEIGSKMAEIGSKTAEIDPKMAEIDPKMAEIDPKSAEIDPKMAEIDPKTVKNAAELLEKMEKAAVGGEIEAQFPFFLRGWRFDA